MASTMHSISCAAAQNLNRAARQLLECGGQRRGSHRRGPSMLQSVSVYVRVRPFTPAETAKGLQPLDGLALESTAPEDKCAAVVLASSRADISGFTGLLGQEADTAEVFERSLAQKLEMVLGGGAVSLFCYGYTGGGKTHTVLGNSGERGMYFLAAERLLRDLNAMQPAGGAEEQRLFLHATVCEIYNDAVYDLLGEQKVKCTLRVDESGTLRVLRPPVSERDSEQDASQVDSLLEQMTEEQRVELHSARDRMDALGIPSVWDGSLHSTGECIFLPLHFVHILLAPADDRTRTLHHMLLFSNSTLQLSRTPTLCAPSQSTGRAI